MPYSSVNDLPKGVKDNLPSHAQTIFMSAFNSAYTGATCKNDSNKDECASKVAWSAVKNAGYHKDASGKWVGKSEAIKEFSFIITKASYDPQSDEYRWSATASDINWDLKNQRMSVELYQDFITRALANEKVPEEYQSKAWAGGMPYLSVSHYPDLGGTGMAGDTVNLYMDGSKLKAKGLFRKTPLGIQCWKAVDEGLKVSDNPKKIRISIGFLDWKHSHPDGIFERKSVYDRCPLCTQSSENVIFLKGQLVHLALTRVPANVRTDINVEVEKSMKTRKEDAESIIGEELAEELDKKTKLVDKSVALVEKADKILEPPVEIAPETVPSPTVENPVVEEDKNVEWVEEPAEAVIDEKAVASSARDTQKSRSAKYGIAVLSQGNVTKPGQWSSVSDSDWGDPVNYRYPMPDDAHIRNALSRFGQEKGSYKGKDIVKARIEKKAKSAGIGAPAQKSDVAEIPVEKLKEESLTTLMEKIDTFLEKSKVPVVVHPLDEIWITFKSAYDEIVQRKNIVDQKLVDLQLPFENLAGVIRDSVKATPEVADEPIKDVTPETLKSVLGEMLQPLTDKMQLMEQRLDQKTLNPSRPSIPAPRSLRPVPTASVQKSEDVMPKTRKLINKSVGL